MNLCGSELVGVREPSEQLVGHLATDELAELWYSDFVATDWRYVERYYREDKKIPPWDECVATGQPLVHPAAIPPLKHRLGPAQKLLSDGCRTDNPVRLWKPRTGLSVLRQLLMRRSLVQVRFAF